MTRKAITIHILTVDQEKLYMAGTIFDYDEAQEELSIVDEKDNSIPLSFLRAPSMDRAATDEKPLKKCFYFEISLPLHFGAIYHISYKDKNETGHPLQLKYGQFSRLTNLDHSFFCQGAFLIKAIGKNVHIYENRLSTRLVSTRRYDATLKKEAPADMMDLRRQAQKLKRSGKPIWLISDRTDAAGDNGEALFEYLHKVRASEKYDIFFLLDSSCTDYERMRSIGTVIEPGSREHLLYFLASAQIISSGADNWFINPLGKDLVWCRDLVTCKITFLQHGITQGDLSSWLFKLKKNLRLFICATYSEWASIVHGNYAYDESVVKLTGMARYDKLENDPQRIVAFMPTWRSYLVASKLPGSSDHVYSETFRDSEYFCFFNQLINDPGLLEVMSERGYRGIFYLHPNLRNQYPDFGINDIITVYDRLTPYRKAFSESALMVTDYSSIAFDFAYLGKPVIYTQFYEEKYKTSHTHIKSGYNYIEEGFGPVCPDYETTVAAIIDFLRCDCRQKDIYRERADHFFAFRDKNNCERIYEELTKL